MAGFNKLQRAIKIGEAANYLHNLYLVEEYEYVVSLAKKGEKPLEMNRIEMLKFIIDLCIIEYKYLSEVAAIHIRKIDELNQKIWEEYSPKKGE